MRLFSDQKRLLQAEYQAGSAANALSLSDEAIGQAYRSIAGSLPWSYLHRRSQVNTVAPQSTGTVQYTASTRTLVLTGATWPTWVANGLLLISGQIYAVQSQTNSTTIILMAGRCPVSNIAALTTYNLFQTEYVLPADFVRMEEMVQVGSVWGTNAVQPGSMLELTRLFYTPTRPCLYLIRGSTYATGRLCVEFGPPPDAAYTYDISYYAKPRQRTLQAEYTTGTVTVAGTAVTGTATAFTSAMVGCQLRVAVSGTAAPVGEFGAAGSVNENTIASVTDGTHLTLVDAGVTGSGLGFIIDDPIDLERGSMDELFCRMCDFQFATLLRADDRTKREDEMVRALNIARARDVRMSPRTQPFVSPSFEAMALANLGGR